MGLADTFGAEDRVQVKFSDFYKLMKQATQYEIAMNAVGCLCCYSIFQSLSKHYGSCQ